VTGEPAVSANAAPFRVLETARLEGRPFPTVPSRRQANVEWTLQQCLRQGKIGALTHVSCIDRRLRPDTRDDLAGVEYAQLLNVAVHDFDSLRRIFDLQPVSVIARCTSPSWSPHRHGATTEAFVQLSGELHLHYYGSLASNRTEHSLWVEGQQGVLWTNRARVWYRKRGWPVFLPLPTRSAPADTSVRPGGDNGALEAFRTATLRGQMPDPSQGQIWTLAIVEAAIRSDKTRSAVAVADLFPAAEGSAVAGVGSRHAT
jgi:predicted dehydrogenase